MEYNTLEKILAKHSREIRMTEKERQLMERRLFAHIQKGEYSQKVESPYGKLLFFSQRIAVFLLIVALMVGMSKPASAKSLPGELLYPIKIIHEEIEAASIKEPEKKAQYQIERTKKRVKEVFTLRKEKKLNEEQEKKVAEQIKKQVEEVAKVVEEMKDEEAEKALKINSDLSVTLKAGAEVVKTIAQENEKDIVIKQEESSSKKEEDTTTSAILDVLEEGVNQATNIKEELNETIKNQFDTSDALGTQEGTEEQKEEVIDKNEDTLLEETGDENTSDTIVTPPSTEEKENSLTEQNSESNEEPSMNEEANGAEILNGALPLLTEESEQNETENDNEETLQTQEKLPSEEAPLREEEAKNTEIPPSINENNGIESEGGENTQQELEEPERLGDSMQTKEQKQSEVMREMTSLEHNNDMKVAKEEDLSLSADEREKARIAIKSLQEELAHLREENALEEDPLLQAQIEESIQEGKYGEAILLLQEAIEQIAVDKVIHDIVENTPQI